MKGSSNTGSFDKVMDSLYGKAGTEQRKEFRREAYAYCAGQIVHDARKREGLTKMAACIPLKKVCPGKEEQPPCQGKQKGYNIQIKDYPKPVDITENQFF